MSGAARPLQPANRSSAGDASSTRDSGSASPGPNKPAGGGRQKRTLIESACSACRRRKSRCDGVRPSCSRCQNLRTDCYYEAEEGESRWSALRRRNQQLETERSQLRELMAFLQTRPDSEAQDILFRIRNTHYDDLFALLRDIKEGGVALPPQMIAPTPSSSSSSVEQRLPPIQTILRDSVLPAPISLDHSHSLSSEDSRDSVVSSNNLPSMPLLDTLEPTLRRQPPRLGLGPSLSSEESTGSTGSVPSVPHDLHPHSAPPP